jgi:integrase
MSTSGTANRFTISEGPALKNVRLPGLPGSAEFMAAYQAALGGVITQPQIGASRTKPGSLNALIVGFYQSLTFRELAPSTQAKRRAILERLREKHGDDRVATLPKDFILRMMSRMKPVTARNWLKTLRPLLDFAVAEGFRADNPTYGVKPPKHKSKSHHPWTQEELAQFEARHPIGSKARLAFALGLYTGQRRSDVIRMGPRDIRNGEIHVKQVKTGVEVDLPIDPALQAVLDATPCQHLLFVTTTTGKPYHGNDFSMQFRSWCDAAGLPKACNFHGLRHTAGYQIADAGGTEFEVAAVLGHKSLSMVQRYTGGANQRKLARSAIRKRTTSG